jgi:HSP20 family protein
MNTATKNEEKTNSTAQKIDYTTPRANILETKDNFILSAEMPGVKKDKVEISVENNELVIIGRRADTPPPGDAIYRESRLMDFRRVFALDPSIGTAKIKAKMEQGVLTVELPKSEQVKPRTIKIE